MHQLKRPAASHVEAEPHLPRTLVERAYLGLRHDVISGKLAPGERLRVEHLKDQYEVGAGTLREALSLLVSDALVTSEGQRGFRVAPISMTDLEDVTNTRVMLETDALRQSIRHGDAQWEAALQQSYDLLSKTERDLAESGSDLWERRNKSFHEALIAGFDSNWSKYLLSILNHHAERYRHINFRLTAAHASGRDVHQEHEAIFRAAINRQEARAALALEAHIRLTHDVVRLQASQAALK
ncbi:GntR family transcriptional regulator [Malikia spinosa]|uniref:GntR family transcriptional regulator n=1 Tax=Malikia spinosa TaxID=86180 RepID=A0A7C9NEF9_9BURK|nr:GntR family transcriptional regulator [Malikia spinosa]MYZ50903.1 GntR family transcriptional regulator [Malikia spinosa]